MNRQRLLLALLVTVITSLAFGGGWLAKMIIDQPGSQFNSPFIDAEYISKPLQQYAIPELRNRELQTSPITLQELTETTDTYSSGIFSYTTMGKTMTGEVKIPATVLAGSQPEGIIVMLRGYVPLEIYRSGVGTTNAASVFAENGYITLAPDFFGFGGSDPEPENSWEARFIKPVNVLELLTSISSEATLSPGTTELPEISLDQAPVGIWAHSNGGAIALTTLEITDQSIPTTLWAPVTAPFPYSILYFGDELADEGKAQRAWLALLEEDYDVFDFSLTKHLDHLQGPLQIQQGTNDDAVLKWWSDEFVQKIEQENDRRSESTASGELDPIELDYHLYPGANHNLQPNWNTAVQRDLQFFAQHLTE